MVVLSFLVLCVAATLVPLLAAGTAACAAPLSMAHARAFVAVAPERSASPTINVLPAATKEVVASPAAAERSDKVAPPCAPVPTPASVEPNMPRHIAAVTYQVSSGDCFVVLLFCCFCAGSFCVSA